MQLVHHFSRCLTCLDANYDPGTAPLCPNGRRLWDEACMPPIPYPMPAEYGPRDRGDSRVEWRPGPLVPKELVN